MPHDTTRNQIRDRIRTARLVVHALRHSSDAAAKAAADQELTAALDAAIAHVEGDTALDGTDAAAEAPTALESALTTLEKTRAAYRKAQADLNAARAAQWKNRYNTRPGQGVSIEEFDAACRAYDAAEADHAAALAAYRAIRDAD